MKPIKGPKISDCPPTSPLFKFTKDIGQCVKIQATSKSNITKLSNQIKAALTVIEDEMYLGNNPECSNITEA